MKNLVLIFSFSIFFNTFTVNYVKLRALVAKLTTHEQHNRLFLQDTDASLIEEVREYSAMSADMLQTMPENASRQLTLERFKAEIEKIMVELLQRLRLRTKPNQFMHMLTTNQQEESQDPIFILYKETVSSLNIGAIFPRIFNISTIPEAEEYLKSLQECDSASEEIVNSLKTLARGLFFKLLLQAGSQAYDDADKFARFVEILEHESIENPNPQEQLCIDYLTRFKSLGLEFTSEEKSNIYLEITASYLKDNTPTQAVSRTRRQISRGTASDALPGFSELVGSQRMTPDENSRRTQRLLADFARQRQESHDDAHDALPGLAELRSGIPMSIEENNRETQRLMQEYARQHGAAPSSDLIFFVAHSISQSAKKSF